MIKKLMINPEKELGTLEKKTEKVRRKRGLEDIIWRRETGEVPKEVESWLSKIEKREAKVPTVTDDQGQSVLDPVSPESVKITLPMTEGEFIRGVKEKVNKAVRWFSEQCFRLIKKYGGKVSFKKEEVK